MTRGPHSEREPSPPPRVSVSMLAYRHGPYIGRAIDSVLAQEVDFPIEIVIGEDCSPDDTRDVLLAYQERHPDVIRLRLYDQNVGAPTNYVETLADCRGEYIALLDGDDWWTAPDKLRRQVELLDARPELSMCFTSVRKVLEGSDVEPVVRVPKGEKPVYRLADLADWIGIHTSSVLLRRRCLPEFPAWFFTGPCGDWPTFVMLAEQGDLAWIPEVMSVHRLHEGGEWSRMREDRIGALSSNVRMLELLIAHLGEERSAAFHDAMYRRFYDLAHAHADLGQAQAARDYLERCVSVRGWADRRVSAAEPFKILLKLRAPALDRALRGLRDALLGAPQESAIRD